MSGGFKRSSLFGLIGVVVVAIVVVVIASSAGNEANPKGTMALIFGVLAVFFVVLFILQRSDLEKVAGGNVRAVERAVAEGDGKIENPTTMAEQDLWAALAVKPIDVAAIKARSQVWNSSRRSLRLGMIVTLLIFLTVPSIYLFESFLPLLIGGPLIAIAAIYGSIRAIGPGGEVSKAFDSMDQAMQPLGLSVVRRPQVRFETREPAMPGFSPRLSGPTVLDGERHSRTVSVQIGGHEDAGVTEVVVAAATPEFAARSSDGKVKPAEGAPAAIESALRSVPNSNRWKKLTVKADGRGIVVTRKGGGQVDWLCDLWLAERLADAA